MLVNISPYKPNSQLYFENLFQEQDLNCKVRNFTYFREKHR